LVNVDHVAHGRADGNGRPGEILQAAEKGRVGVVGPLRQTTLRLELEQVLDLCIRQEASGLRGEEERASARPLVRL
jgi:hypothetical protein